MSRAVIDQPGFRVSLVGMALSLFIGLAIQTQISDTRVQKYLSHSIDRLQKDFIVDFGSAQISLSRWGLPLPYLHIHKIRLSPKNNLCQSSQIYIDALEVPFSLGIIFGNNKSVPVSVFRIWSYVFRI